MTAITWRSVRGNNFTRRSSSIPRRLISEGKWYLLPAYALARTSDLAREGMDNSGSFRFADHIYRGKPSGRYVIGWLLDALFLALPAAKSMRERYLHSRLHIATLLRRSALKGESARVLSVPCGIARDLVGGANDARPGSGRPTARARLIGMDLDPEAIALSRALAGRDRTFEFVEGDALRATSYPRDLDLIVSTGLGEFLDDDELARFYAACFSALRPGGRFVTSGMSRSKLADRLLRELAELHTRYRDADALTEALDKAGFTDIDVHSDRYGLQWLATAVRPPEAA